MKHLVTLFILPFILVACTIAVPANSPECHEGYVVNEPASGVLRIVTPVYVDIRFDPLQRRDIHAALGEWTHTFNGYAAYVVMSDEFDMQPEILERLQATGQGMVILANKTGDDLVEALPDGTLAWVPVLGAPVIHVVSDRIGNRNLKAIVMHELGHTLGIGHVNVRNTLMFPSYPFGSDCIDEITVRALSSVNTKFDFHHMNYCRHEN